MKTFSLCLGLALLAAPAMAQTPIEKIAPLAVAPKLATVTPFITGLKEPQGMALDNDGNLLICDYISGEILKFSPDGKTLDKLATELKGPSAIETVARQVFVTERNANRVIRFRDGKMDVVMANVFEPIGLIVDKVLVSKFEDMPFYMSVVSHKSSKINGLILMKFGSIGNNPKRRVINATQRDAATKEHYSLSWLARDPSGYWLVSDEAGKRILLLTNDHIATFASGISIPSGIAAGPDKMVYVANEGDGGQLIRLNSEGEKIIVAEKLGRPCAILILDAKTLLVSNRDGNIWKVVLP